MANNRGTKWEFCEIYERLTNFEYANAQGKMVVAEYYNALKFSIIGEEVGKTELWIPDFTTRKNIPLDDKGNPIIHNFDGKRSLRSFLSELGLDGWEVISLNEDVGLGKPICLLKRKIE